MKALFTSETLASVYKSTPYYSPEDRYFTFVESLMNVTLLQVMNSVRYSGLIRIRRVRGPVVSNHRRVRVAKAIEGKLTHLE